MCFKRYIFPGRIDLNMNNCIKIHEKKKVHLKQKHSNCLKKKKKVEDSRRCTIETGLWFHAEL